MTNNEQLCAAVEAAGLSPARKYRIVRGGFAGDTVTIDTHNGFIGSDGTPWIIVLRDGAQMCRASIAEFKQLAAEIPA